MLVVWFTCGMKRSQPEAISDGLSFPKDREKSRGMKANWFAFCKPQIQIDGIRSLCEVFSNITKPPEARADFEKHSGKETARRWKYIVWVIVKEKKVPLLKTALLKYHKRPSKSRRGQHARQLHRDEFICCTKCNKEHRFRLQTKEECRIFHDAVANHDWKCSDLPFNKKSKVWYYAHRPWHCDGRFVCSCGDYQK